MAASMFVQITDVPGDATEAEHTAWIVVKTISWGLERAVDLSDLGSSQRGYANANFQKISVTSEMGTASAKLMQLAANGVSKGDIIIDCCRVTDAEDGAMETYLKLTLNSGQVTKYDVSLSEDGVPEETWEMGYRKITCDYTHVDADTFKKGSPNQFTWDLQTGKPI